MPEPQKKILVVECYQGVLEEEITDAFRDAFRDALFIPSSSAMRSEKEINEKLKEDITEDEIFGYMTRYHIDCYFDPGKTEAVRKEIAVAGNVLVIVYGTGAAYIQPEHNLLVYADMARWEIQMRFRQNLVSNVGINNKDEPASLQYKRAFFVDWRVCDRFKKQLMPEWDYVLDTHIRGNPKMTTGETIRAGLREAVRRPFRVVPFFDPGPWGGQWMKEVCDLDRDTVNFAWCFDCVPEENSLLLGIGDVTFEIPSVNLVFAHPKELLGDPVHARFGDEFPIRFDFLDTMDGGNLSLQVHPLTEYIQEMFGMHYTQDESYYLLDAEEDAVVYLGLKDNVDSEAMIHDLEEAQRTGRFDADKYAGCFPVKKHDHVLIPGGTVHCSGKNAMVLEISATPFIFTFKLWDWGRLGLDGRPRPINIAHGKKVIQWERTESWVRKNILDRTEKIAKGDGWTEERTGLHEREFIETRRHWFTKPVLHATNGCVHVLNVVEGREVIVESPTGAFSPFVVHYAETFIVPGNVEEYTIRPYGESEGKQCGTIKAYVRNNA
jgi:mannose-6-phosphate isomerase class I